MVILEGLAGEFEKQPLLLDLALARTTHAERIGYVRDGL